MIKKLLLLFCLGLCVVLVARGQENDTPASWSYDSETTIAPIVAPPIDFTQVRAQDSINDLDKSLPYRYGIEVPLRVDLKTQGEYIELPDGAQVWRVAIQSKNAVNISVNFDQFRIPFGGKLQMYSDDRNDVSKTYSFNDNRENEMLGAWFVSGDHIWIEYFQPANTSGNFAITIESIIHGYRMGEVSQFMSATRGLNDSGACNYDVNCSLGADFDTYKNTLKKAVALLNLGNGYLCSSVLLNNVEQDKTPYLLTANHCLDNSDPALWSIRFNWVSPTPICGTGESNPDIQSNFTLSGAEVRARNSLSDFALVELVNPVPDSWDIAFAGWDNSDRDPVFEVGIHHPNGDVMKVCRDDSGAVKEVAQGTEVWLIEGVSAGNGNGWEIGTTESGSSGSPLFNETGKVIGQLYAGNSSCNGTENNNDYDIYGRFGVSWNSGSASNERLMDWLDPLATGTTTIETMTNILGVGENEFTGLLQVYPNPASIFITIMNSKYPNLTYTMHDVSGKMVQRGTLFNTNNTISVTQLKQGVYFLNLKDEDGGGNITKKILVAH